MGMSDQGTRLNFYDQLQIMPPAGEKPGEAGQLQPEDETARCRLQPEEEAARCCWLQPEEEAARCCRIQPEEEAARCCRIQPEGEAARCCRIQPEEEAARCCRIQPEGEAARCCRIQPEGEAEHLLLEQECARKRLLALRRPLLGWYHEHARNLPWRDSALSLSHAEDFPYRVWISEIMLQQTRVEAVKPYFERFISALPGISKLASVPEEQLLKLWEGLGYYSRARNLQKAAQILVTDYQGRLPSSYAELLKLPGIGSYTAGAIASIAYGIPVPAVDGNVLRVLSRVLLSRRDILKSSTKRWLEDILATVIPTDHAGHFNQGLIEIGALVCIPGGAPKCTECPCVSFCLAKIQGLISEIPVKTSKKKRRIEYKTVAVLQFEDTLALRKRKNEGLLAALYEFPNVEGQLSEAELAEAFGLAAAGIAEVQLLPSAKHIFTHVEWHMIGYRIILKQPIPDSYLGVSKEALVHSYPLPGAFAAYRKVL